MRASRAWLGVAGLLASSCRDAAEHTTPSAAPHPRADAKDTTPPPPPEGLPNEAGCDAPPLTAAAVEQAVDRERARRTDLPPPFVPGTRQVRARGCHYSVVEWSEPPIPDRNHVFTVNRRGLVVDLTIGNSLTSPIACSTPAIDEQELDLIVAIARTKRPSLPAKFPAATTRVDRPRCLAVYFEYLDPPQPGAWQAFTIDAFGEVIDATRNVPAAIPQDGGAPRSDQSHTVGTE